MELEEAIKSAIAYENRIHSLYRNAQSKATDSAGQRIFRVLADEEKGHVDYLKSRLEEWQQTGHLTPEKLATAIPARERIEEEVARLKEHMEPQESSYDLEVELLRQALQVEIETSEFYQRMVAELEDEGKELFERFLAIEEGHQAIVQAEIDCVNGLGYWFGHKEFNLEAM